VKLICAIKQGGRWGYLSEAGQFAIPPRFDALGELREGLISFRLDDKIGFLNEAGQVIIPAKFDPEEFVMRHFSEDLVPVRTNGLAGYINKSGHFAIQPQFTWAWDFRRGKAIVLLSGNNGGFWLIDGSGRPMNRLNVYEIKGLMDWPEDWECFKVFLDAERLLLTQWINYRGEVVFGACYPWMTNWNNGVCGFCDHEDRTAHPWGLVNLTGGVIAYPRFWALAGCCKTG
jgi:hypothetical protein